MAQTAEQKAATIAKRKATIEAKKKAANTGIPPEVKTVKKILTAEDIALLPEGHGFNVGDEVEVEDENAGDNGVAGAAKDNKIVQPKANATEVDIVRNDNEYVRTYSEEVHGENFLDLANEFCAANQNSVVVDADAVKKVVVNYRSLDKKTGVSTDTSRTFSLEKDGEEFKTLALAFKNEKNGSTVVR